MVISPVNPYAGYGSNPPMQAFQRRSQGNSGGSSNLTDEAVRQLYATAAIDRRRTSTSNIDIKV